MPNANRDKGIRAERDVVKYLVALGSPDGWKVRRSAETGTATRQDEGDIRGIPGVVIQVRDRPSVAFVDRTLESMMDEVEAQRVAAGASVAVLVEKRAGQSAPGRWWCHVHHLDLVVLTGGMFARGDFLVRTPFEHVAPLLIAYGRNLEWALAERSDTGTVDASHPRV